MFKLNVTDKDTLTTVVLNEIHETREQAEESFAEYVEWAQTYCGADEDQFECSIVEA